MIFYVFDNSIRIDCFSFKKLVFFRLIRARFLTLHLIRGMVKNFQVFKFHLFWATSSFGKVTIHFEFSSETLHRELSTALFHLPVKNFPRMLRTKSVQKGSQPPTLSFIQTWSFALSAKLYGTKLMHRFDYLASLNSHYTLHQRRQKRRKTKIPHAEEQRVVVQFSVKRRRIRTSLDASFFLPKGVISKMKCVWSSVNVMKCCVFVVLAILVAGKLSFFFFFRESSVFKAEL